jgi:hypothetical protein
MPKLTLSVDPAVAANAKEWARRKGTSVSHLVEVYLSSVTMASSGHEAPDPPVLRSLRGVLKKADPDAYKKHLSQKYR